MDKPTKEEIQGFLMALRDSGVVNMFGATPYLMKAYGMTQAEARNALVQWMKDMSKGAKV